MPQFLITARDKASSTDLRKRTRSDHLDWARSHADRILMAGPILTEDEADMIGSVFLISAASLEDARLWNEDDPYSRAGLFQSVDIMPVRWLLGEGRPGAKPG